MASTSSTVVVHECMDGHQWESEPEETRPGAVPGSLVQLFTLEATTCPTCGLFAHEDGKDGIRLPSAVRAERGEK
jgi:hypothetical protein